MFAHPWMAAVVAEAQAQERERQAQAQAQAQQAPVQAQPPVVAAAVLDAVVQIAPEPHAARGVTEEDGSVRMEGVWVLSKDKRNHCYQWSWWVTLLHEIKSIEKTSWGELHDRRQATIEMPNIPQKVVSKSP